VPPHHLVAVVRLLEPLGGVFADRFEHREACSVAAEQVFLDKRLEAVEVGIADVLRGFEGATTGEHREAREESLLAGREQVMAPGDRRFERALAFRRVAGAAPQQREPLVESLEQCFRRQDLRARGGELDRQRQAIEVAADRDHRLLGSSGIGAPAEELDRLLLSKRRHQVLALAGQVQRLPASGEQLEARAGGQQLAQHWSAGEEVLAVVEDEQQPPLGDSHPDVVLVSDRQRLGNARRYQRRVAQTGERHPEHTFGIVGRHLDGGAKCEPRLARAAGTGQRQQSQVGAL
jgi:hypothetical protein